MRTDNVLVIDVEIEENISPFMPLYRGPYVFTPKSTEQEIATKDMITWRNFIINPIPYREEENEFGGITAIIGGEYSDDQQG